MGIEAATSEEAKEVAAAVKAEEKKVEKAIKKRGLFGHLLRPVEALVHLHR